MERLRELLFSRAGERGLLSSADLAAVLGRTAQHWTRLASRGSLPAFDLSGGEGRASWGYDPEDLLAWLGRRHNGARQRRVHPAVASVRRRL